MTYEKLVRDRIPDIIEAVGRPATPVCCRVTSTWQALLTKLLEEARKLKKLP